MVNASWLNTEDDSDLTELSTDEEPEPQAEVLVAPPPSVVQARSHPTPGTCGRTRKLTRPSTQEATQKSKARITDKFPKPALGLSRISPMTAWALYGMKSVFQVIYTCLIDFYEELIKQGQIELNPEYQRGKHDDSNCFFAERAIYHHDNFQVLYGVNQSNPVS
jgi:hypothetical protein